MTKELLLERLYEIRDGLEDLKKGTSVNAPWYPEIVRLEKMVNMIIVSERL